MAKCPFCQYVNEEGALFCEQCKSDLGVEPDVAIAQSVDIIPPATVPMAKVMDDSQSFVQPGAAHSVTIAEPAFSDVAADTGIPKKTPIQLPPAPPLAEPYAHLKPSTVVPKSSADPATPTTAEAAPASPKPSSGSSPAIPELLLPSQQPKLLVVRGLKINSEYPLYEGENYIGRADEKPVDIDLEEQESPQRIWSSRQHARITFEDGRMIIEDLKSANGTFVNRTRVHPGQKRVLKIGDILQIGTVQLRVKV